MGLHSKRRKGGEGVREGKGKREGEGAKERRGEEPGEQKLISLKSKRCPFDFLIFVSKLLAIFCD